MRFPKITGVGLVVVSMVLPVVDAHAGTVEGKELYRQYCAPCHHSQRYGLSGPPLIPETIGKKKDRDLAEIVRDGLPASNMPAFGTLSEAQIADIVAFLRSPVRDMAWGVEEMLGTLKLSDDKPLSPRPNPDMTNLFMIVEGGRGDVHFMDGDTFTLLDKVHVGTIHGGPKYDEQMKYAYLGGRDGWVVKYDLDAWREVARVRGGINTRNIAVSKDGKVLAVANALPANVTLIDTATLKPLKIIDAPGKSGAVYALRNSARFVISFRDRAELWFMDTGTLEIEKVALDQPFSDFFIEPNERFLIGAGRDGDHISIFDLERKKVTQSVKGEGMPHLASAALWGGRWESIVAYPHITAPRVTFLELVTVGDDHRLGQPGSANEAVVNDYRWEIKKEVKLKGAGFFARTHNDIPDVWVDTGSDTIQLLSKKTGSVRELVPSPGKRAMHIEFTKDGRFALVSIWETDGAVVIYDTASLKEVKRLPFNRPVGKYNATLKLY
ncbi:MAG: nitrite reductase [Nitrospirota bacterium]|nr:nitrite reductase [Nitrospirota bacterium]